MFGVCISSPKAIFSGFVSQGALNTTTLFDKTNQEEALLWIYSVSLGKTPKIILLWTKVRCTVPDFHLQETYIYMHQNEPTADRPGSLVFPDDVTADWRSKIHYEVNSVLISNLKCIQIIKKKTLRCRRAMTPKPTAKSSEDQLKELKEGEKKHCQWTCQPLDLNNKEHCASSDYKP